MVNVVRSLLLASVVLVELASADIVFDNEVIVQADIFDLVYAVDSNVWAPGNNQSKYYCVFRSNWNKVNHPEDFPNLARWGQQALFSHTKQYVPYLQNREAPFGVEKLAEVRQVRNLSTEGACA
jgi:hypothetical protein